MNRKLLQILLVFLCLSLLSACKTVTPDRTEFDSAIERMVARTTCHTSEEWVMTYPDTEVTLNIDRMHDNGDSLYIWTQNSTPASMIVECEGERYDHVYYEDGWVQSEMTTALSPLHLTDTPENYYVKSIEETSDSIIVKCQIDTSGVVDTEYKEATAEFILDTDWNVMEYTMFTSYMMKNHDDTEFLLSTTIHVTFLSTEEEYIRQAIQDTFAAAQEDSKTNQSSDNDS